MPNLSNFNLLEEWYKIRKVIISKVRIFIVRTFHVRFLLVMMGIVITGFIFRSNVFMYVLGKIAWTGVEKAVLIAAIKGIIEMVVLGTSVVQAIQTICIISAASTIAAPLGVILTMAGRGYLIRLVRKKGLQWVIMW